MFDDLAVELSDCIATRVTIIDYAIKAIQLTVLLLGIEACQVLCSHQVLSQELALVADLSCGYGRYADDVRGVVHRAEDLKLGVGAIPAHAPAALIIQELLLARLSRPHSGHLTHIIMLHDGG